MLDLGRKYFSMDFLENYMKFLSWYKMNTLHLHFTENNAFRLNSDKFPGLASSKSYSRSDIKKLEEIAKKYCITIVPEIDLPAHCDAILKYWPQLKNEDASLKDGGFLSLAKDETYKVVNQMLDEFIPWFSGPYFHIGSDEYTTALDNAPALKKYAASKNLKKPGDLFVRFLNEVNKTIKKHGKTMRIWEDFARFNTDLTLDSDIVIDVWHPDKAQGYIDEGHKIVNCSSSYLYLTPGGGLIPNNELLYNEWRVGVFGASAMDGTALTVDEGNENLLGAKMEVWCDGMLDKDDKTFDVLIRPSLKVLGEITWSNVRSSDYDAFKERVGKVGEPLSFKVK